MSRFVVCYVRMGKGVVYSLIYNYQEISFGSGQLVVVSEVAWWCNT